MTIMVPDVTPGVIDMTALEADFKREAPCESKHRVSTCSSKVVWSAPALPCGCVPRRNVCQAVYDYTFSAPSGSFVCVTCGHVTPSEENRKGWYRV